MSDEAVVALSAHARWIGRDPDAVDEIEPPVFDDRPGITRDLRPPDIMRVEVPVHGVHRAELVATAKGLFRCWIDGERVGDDELAPGWTDYRVRVPVRRYDVTDLVTAAASNGRLCWAALIADGWYCGYLGMDRRRQACWYGTTPAFRAVLVIETGSDVINVGTDAVVAARHWRDCLRRLVDGTAHGPTQRTRGLEAGRIRRRRLVIGQLWV